MCKHQLLAVNGWCCSIESICSVFHCTLVPRWNNIMTMRNHTVGCVEIPTHNWYYNWLQLKVDPQTDGDWINGASDVLYNKFGSVCVCRNLHHIVTLVAFSLCWLIAKLQVSLTHLMVERTSFFLAPECPQQNKDPFNSTVPWTVVGLYSVRVDWYWFIRDIN